MKRVVRLTMWLPLVGRAGWVWPFRIRIVDPLTFDEGEG